jgi:hypothetical protein
MLKQLYGVIDLVIILCGIIEQRGNILGGSFIQLLGFFYNVILRRLIAITATG